MLKKSHLHQMLLKLVLNHFLHSLFLCISFLCIRLSLYRLR